MGTQQTRESKHPEQQTPTFLLELPLQVEAGQAKRLRAHLEAGRQFYNAVLSEGQKRIRRMKADPAWQAARALSRMRPLERRVAFSALRNQYGFSDYAFQDFAKEFRVSWLAEHLDAVLAQRLATRAYQALNRVGVGKAKRVRFKSRGRGLCSIENKRNDTGLRFVLQTPQEGHAGYLVWHDDQLAALINWNDPVVKHSLDHHIKYARLIRRKASSERAAGADGEGCRYFVQLALEGVPYHKPRHTVGSDTIGADLGPSTIALVARQGEASLEMLGEELAPDERQIRRLQRKMDRQRRAANPEHYDEQGRIKKARKTRLPGKNSRGYERTRRCKAEKERKLAAHRKSLHGRKVHEIVSQGNLAILSRLWQDGEKAVVAAVACVRVWSRSHSTRPVFRVSGRPSGYSKRSSLLCPVPGTLGGCGDAPCAEEARFTLLRVRSPTGVNVGKATSYLMGKPKGDSSMTEQRLDGLST